MVVIAEYQNGACKIKVYDDSFKSPEEVQNIVRRVSQLVYNEQLQLHMQAMNSGSSEKKLC